QILYFQPDRPEPIFVGIADALGTIRSRGLWISMNHVPPDTAESPKEPVVVAFLPGATGAVIAPPAKPGQPLKLVLPEARRLEGWVTVGGKVCASAKGTVRILAVYQGKGKLDDTLSVQTTADADGKFELAGLSQGTYKVQAVLDEIWLSQTMTLEVGAEL